MKINPDFSQCPPKPIVAQQRVDISGNSKRAGPTGKEDPH
jgi:hypothetical protein